MNYFSYYKELTDKVLPVAAGVQATKYHKQADINLSALKAAFNEFSMRNLNDGEFADLLQLCLNGIDRGDFVLYTTPKHVEDAKYHVDRQGFIVRLA